MSRAISERQKVTRKRWRKRLLDWEQSDLTQSAYCREKGLNLRNFQYWRKKLRQLQNPQPASENNSEIKVVEIQAGDSIKGQPGFLNSQSPFKLKIGEIILELENNFSPQALTRLIQVLKTV